MSDIAQRIAENIAEVRCRIAETAARCGRSARDITMVAVTKYVGAAEARAVAEAGCRVLGESRPQQLWEKAEALKDRPVAWHMIGHIQRNKVRRTLPLATLIESVDSMRLLETIDAEAASLGQTASILLEVNVSGEQAKHGFAPEAVEPLLEQIAACRNIRVGGLMGMAGWGGTQEDARRDFAALRQLRERLRPNCPREIVLDDLSMGMSGDFPAAIAEGATIVRIGSALFEGISR